MYTTWTKGLSEQHKKDIVSNIRASQPFIKRAVEVIEDKLAVSEQLMTSRDSYDKASWPYFQADLLGEQRAYRKILDLLNNVKV